MIDKVIKLGNGLEYYVLDEVKKNNKEYVFAVQVDNETEEVSENYIICEKRINLNETTLSDIADDKEFEEISNMFLKRMEENK